MKYIYFTVLFLSSMFANATHADFKLPDYYASDLFHQKLNVPKSTYDDIKPLYDSLLQYDPEQSFDDVLSIQYLNSPINQPIITLTAIRHLVDSLLVNPNATPASFEHSVLALYYLERLALVSPEPQWANNTKKQTRQNH